MPNSDGEFDLIKTSQEGDVKAMEILITTHSDAVHSFIYSIIGKADLVEDLAQETFLRALNAIKKYESKASFKSWLFRIALNLCRDHFRRQKVRQIITYFHKDDKPDIEPTFTDHSYDPLYNLEKQQKFVIVHEAINQLPQDLRIALVLRDIQDLSYEEISQILNRPLGTVKTRIFRARKQLADILRPQREDLV